MSDYLGVITPAELDQLRSARQPGRTHPVVALAADSTFESANTERAAQEITIVDRPWLVAQRSRLLDTTDFANASSALGEIRAYGALLEASFTVNPQPQVPGKKVIPEFDVDAGDGSVIVEVYNRQMDPSVSAAIAQAEFDVRAGKGMRSVAGSQASITIGEPVSVTPYGVPDPKKQGESVTANVISRVASVKKNETQVDPAKPFVLWLDLQDMTIFGLSVSEEQFEPLYTEPTDGEVGSGGFWFGLYGRKGDDRIEMRGRDYSTTPMLHDGRFYQLVQGHPTRVSAVVFSLPEATVLMEHPEPVLPLPPRFRASMLRTPHFRLDLSLCDWEPNLVKDTVGNQLRTVRAAAQALQATNPP